MCVRLQTFTFKNGWNLEDGIGMRLNALLRKFDSRMNPIAVKELRQISRGKFLPVILIGFLFMQLLVTGAVTFSGSAAPGPELYEALFVWLTVICILLIPAYAGFRLAQEHSDMNKDLLFISTLKPISIVWGKTLSAAVLVALIYSVCMPFIAMTYILRGVDLLSAFLNIVLSYLFTLTAILVGILIGCMPANRFIKGIIGLLGLFLSFFILMREPILPRLIAESPANMSFQEALEAGFRLLWIWAFPSVGFLLLSAAFVSPSSANRAFVPRVYLTAVWAASYIAVFVWDQINGDFDLIMWWFVLSFAGFGWALTVSVSERDEIGLRVRQKIPRLRFQRAFAFLFYSGSGGGFLWASVGLAMTYLFWSCAFAASSGGISSEDFLDYLNRFGFASLNAWNAAVCAVFIHRKFLRNRVSGAYTWLIAIGVYIISNLLWGIFAVDSEAYRHFDLIELLPGIMAVGAAWASENPPTAAAGVIALILGCACIPWIARQAAAFKPAPLETRGTQKIGSA